VHGVRRRRFGQTVGGCPMVSRKQSESSKAPMMTNQFKAKDASLGEIQTHQCRGGTTQEETRRVAAQTGQGKGINGLRILKKRRKNLRGLTFSNDN